MQPMRQGDVILRPLSPVYDPQNFGQPLSHLILAEGEVTGHRHQISEGQACLYQKGQTRYLHVVSESAILTHEEHQAIAIPQGNWLIKIQREYEPRTELHPQDWRPVSD